MLGKLLNELELFEATTNLSVIQNIFLGTITAGSWLIIDNIQNLNSLPSLLA